MGGHERVVLFEILDVARIGAQPLVEMHRLLI